jgi:hypothetical protein
MGEKWYIKIWTGKKYLDLWSINHTLAGCNLAGLFLFVNAHFLASVIATFLILLLWEFFEFFHGIHEVIQNRISDIIVGMCGFFITHYLMLNNAINNTTFFAIIFLVGLILGIWGFWAYEKIKK